MLFTKDHEYVNVSGDVASVGISDHAQAQLGDIVYVELPEVGAKLDKGAVAAVVESVKAASDVFSPISGEVVAVNTILTSQTALVNEDAQGRAWLFQLKLSDLRELDELMDEAAYSAFLETID